MREDEIIGILSDWNFWKGELYAGIRRDEYVEKAISFLKSNMIVSITGARRSGKSFILRQIAKTLIGQGVDPKEILIVNFEDRRFAEHSVKLLDDIFNTYLEYLNPKSVPYVFVDEVQLVDKWERWARTLHELQKAKIIVSGSTSELISRELGTILTGRHLDIKVFPLSFKEFLKFRDVEIKDKLDIISKKIELKRLLSEYMQWGGFPEVVLSKTKNEILVSYFDDIITKDVVKRFGIRKIDKIEGMAKFCLSNISKDMTFRSIERTFKISKNTAEKYSWYLQNALLLFFLKRFSFSVKEQENAPRKMYSLDSGLSNALGFKFSEDSGRLMENLVAVELQRTASQNPLASIYYWKDSYGKEVDFTVKYGTEITELIQVTKASSLEEVDTRESSALLSALEKLKLKDGLIITDDYEYEAIIENKKVKYIPLWKWLLK